jgi:AraC-like DNA-binding protein
VGRVESAPEVSPPVTLDRGDVGAGNTTAARRELTRGFYDTRPLRPEATFDAAAAACWIDDLLLSRVRFDASTFWCHPGRFPSGESDLMTIQWYVRSSIHGFVGDHELYTAPDRISFHDFAGSYQGWSDCSEVWGLTIPRERIADVERLRARSPMFSVPIGSPSGLLLTSALCSAWEAVSRSADGGPELACALVGLVNGVLAPLARRAPDDARLAAMKAFLQRRLGDPNLSVTVLQQQFHYSRATIYRLFKPDGGVAHFVREERLRQCHDELAHSAPKGRATVRGVAARWGFSDPAQFARAFRQRYGHPPAELLRRARAQRHDVRPAGQVGQPPQMSSTKRASARSSASHA